MSIIKKTTVGILYVCCIFILQTRKQSNCRIGCVYTYIKTNTHTVHFQNEWLNGTLSDWIRKHSYSCLENHLATKAHHHFLISLSIPFSLLPYRHPPTSPLFRCQSYSMLRKSRSNVCLCVCDTFGANEWQQWTSHYSTHYVSIRWSLSENEAVNK